MARRRKGLDIHGVLLLDKPAGWSSNQALQRVRFLLQARKAGHCGSLDPFATGMLPICLGEASKTAAFMLEASKTYLAIACLGQATTTGDTEGEVEREAEVPDLGPEQINHVFRQFTGPIRQLPPMYSALKHRGQALYKLARRGIELARESREVTIHSIQLHRWTPPLLTFEVHCSKGTYIRTLAEDMCSALDTCGHLRSLRRLTVEPFATQHMITLEAFELAVKAGGGQDLLLPIDAGLKEWPKVILEQGPVERFMHGNAVRVAGVETGLVRVFGPAGQILGLAEANDGLVHPRRVFVFQNGGKPPEKAK